MASIRKEFTVAAPAAQVWDALRDFTNLHRRLAVGFVVDSVAEEGGAVRRITFANGVQVRERLVTCDDAGMRLVYTAEGGRTTHYNAAAQVFEEPGGGSRFVWLVDLLPDALAPAIDAMMGAGAKAMHAQLEKPQDAA
ncbi:MAG: SRPBCC family protein [Pseudomonadota bacterium]